MNYDREDSKFAIVLVGTTLILVALSLLAITGILYAGLEKRYKIINARIDTMQQGITTFHVWNFEKNKMDIYLAAGISSTSPLPDSPIVPVYATQSFFEKGINKMRQRSIELAESDRATELGHGQTN